MSKCKLCHQRKSKRQCPVAGAICPLCCGQKRGREVSCPVDCLFLEHDVQAQGNALGRVLDRLRDFSFDEDKGWTDNAARAFLGSDTGQEYEIVNLAHYVCLGHRDGSGERCVDRFARRHADELSAAEKAALEHLRNDAWPSVFRVEAVRRGIGLGLVDIVTGEHFFAREKAGTESAFVGKHLLGWAIHMDGHDGLLTVCMIPPAHVGAVEETLRAELANYGEHAEHATIACRAMPAAHRVLRQRINDFMDGKLAGPNGEPPVFGTAIYEAKDPEAIRSKLAECPDLLSFDDGHFVWIERKGTDGDALPKMAEVLGEIELRTVRLSLKVASHRRLQAGKLLLERLLGRLVQHRTDELKSLSGKTLSSDEIQSLPPESPGGGSDRPPVVDVEGAIDGFNEKVGEQIRRFIKEQTDTSKARKPLPLGNRDEQLKRQPPSSETDRPDRALLKEKRHRLPLMAHEVMKQQVPGFGEMVKKTARLLRHDRWEIERVVQSDELAGLKTVDSFL
ncbi:MAG: hypothetical protein V2A73_11255, partial [Pseudomonadota bacterium]